MATDENQTHSIESETGRFRTHGIYISECKQNSYDPPSLQQIRMKIFWDLSVAQPVIIYFNYHSLLPYYTPPHMGAFPLNI